MSEERLGNTASQVAKSNRERQELYRGRQVPTDAGSQQPLHSTQDQRIPNDYQLLVKSTISQDQTNVDSVNEQQLFALYNQLSKRFDLDSNEVTREVIGRRTVGRIISPTLPEGSLPTEAGSHANQDYQMQLMLLQQQNKERLLVARGEQEQERQRLEVLQSQPQRQKVPGESARATALLKQAGINPSFLSATQLESFLAQKPHVQKKSIQTYTQNIASQRRNTMSQDQIGKVLGVRWNALNANAREPYEAKTKADKERYGSEKMSQDQDMGDTADMLDRRASGQDHDMGDTANMPERLASGNMYNSCGTVSWDQQVRMLTNSFPSQGDGKTVAAEADRTKFCQEQPSAMSPNDSHLHSVTSLLATIEKLENENETLQKLAVYPPSPRWQELHRGRLRISDVELYCERHADISFVVYKDYICDGHGGRVREKRAAHGRGNALVVGAEQEVYKSGESLTIVSRILCEALNKLVDGDVQRERRYPAFNIYSEIQGPYLFYYHDRAFFEQKVAQMKKHHVKELDLFKTYVNESLGKEYNEVDELFAQGLVSPKYVKYLFVPNTVLISHAKDQDMAHILETWPKWIFKNSSTYQEQEPTPEGLVEVSSWDFDGCFQKISTQLTIQYGASSGEVKPVRDIDIYPLQYADHKIDVRYMVDIATYRKMHPKAAVFHRRLRDELGPEKMAQDEPPGGEFLLLLPAHVYGFKMQEKKWVELQVQFISPVIWNKQAFESLVVEDDTKELIIALVTNQLVAEKATDLMDGKGNGLIVLLHGGPGTGKTLTAESVAEIAEKPLYRVTCGDIGTDPEAVEKYLATVLNLGKIWGC
ncbi:MAG: hypothetical protein Q9187_006162, partial [Circinaria calcarea]